MIDMPPVDESLWWRGKQGFEVRTKCRAIEISRHFFLFLPNGNSLNRATSTRRKPVKVTCHFCSCETHLKGFLTTLDVVVHIVYNVRVVKFV